MGAMTSLDELIADTWFPFEGDLVVKPLDPLVIPEPDRHGSTAETCGSCRRVDDSYVWTDEAWRITGVVPTQIPGIVLLETRAHIDSFTDMPADLLAALGPMIARVEKAVESLGDIGRVHVNRWGDGGAHFHLWFMPRPLGRLQLRGSMLAMWLDLMPDLPDDEVQGALAAIGAAMARDGGVAH